MQRTTTERTREAARVWRRSVRARVFVAEDDAALRNLVVCTLLDDGHEVYEAASGQELLHLIAFSRRVPPAYGVDLVVLDQRMPTLEGLTIARRLREAQWSVPLVLMTAFPSDELRREARNLDVHVLAKPFALRDLSEAALCLLLTEQRASARAADCRDRRIPR